jgi:diamine N-acetyltransferase
MESHLLDGKNVLLRIPEPADIDSIQTMENDPDIWRFGNTLVPYSRYQVEQYVLGSQHDIYTEKQLRFMIATRPESGVSKVAGTIDLFDFDPHHRRASIGILVLPEERGKGYAAEALQLLIAYCFKVLHFHQVCCNVTADNTASIGLFEHAGFVRCGLKKEWVLQEEGWLDEIMFQLINT